MSISPSEAPRIAAECFTPGDFIQEELDERGWSREHFAALMRWTVRAVDGHIAGEFPITPTAARQLSAVLGTSLAYWLNLQHQYDEWSDARGRR